MRKYALYIASCLHLAAFAQTVTTDAELADIFQKESAQKYSLEYWGDNSDSDVHTCDQLNGSLSLDVSTFSDGLHTLHFRVRGTDGIVYALSSKMFAKLGNYDQNIHTNSEDGTSMLCYWFDNDSETMFSCSGLSGVYSINVASLSEDLHVLNCLLKAANGSVYNLRSEVFVKLENGISELAPGSTPKVSQLKYWIDENETLAVLCDVVSGTQTIDVSQLSSGLHTIYYQLVYEDGNESPVSTKIFLKKFEDVEQEPSRITKYQYILNELNTTAVTHELGDTCNPYQIVSLLPIQNVPIRSSSFHFEMKDEKPVIYAKNDFRIRFHDNKGYFVDGSKSYVDYNVSRNVDGATPLYSGNNEISQRPAKDSIRWFTLEASPGDSLQFKLDKAATIQLYAPSGQELLNRSAADVVKWCGTHVWEDGTYYLALHDVTATQGNTVSLDYEHIDKYAVLRQNVSVVGNGGYNTITFKGNGFRSLYAVTLINQQEDTIHSVLIGHESDARTSVVFDFTGVSVGQYDAVFYFAEESRLCEKSIMVEEEKDIQLVTTLSNSDRFLKGAGKTTFHIKISNEGNMTSYNTPICITLSSSSREGIKKVILKGLGLPSVASGVDTDDFIQEDIEWISAYVEGIGDTHYFQRAVTIDEKDSLYIWNGYFFIDIPPLSKQEFLADIYTEEDVKFEIVTIGENIPLASKRIDYNDEKESKRHRIKDSYCCNRDKWECVANSVANGISIIDDVTGSTISGLAIADCIAGTVNQILQTTGDIMCGNDEHLTFWDGTQKFLRGISIAETLTKCASKILPVGKLKEVMELMAKGNKATKGIDYFSYGVDLGNCINAFNKQNDAECSFQHSETGFSKAVNSFDPNEIYGYVAQSGSKAVKDGLRDLYYTIQFENDTTFATAAAHDIYLTDTLDAAKFDLSTFAPTRIKIGNKTADLTGEKNFVTTVDMRPEIYAIAQVEGSFDEKKGIAKWHISSLDPMTMEPTEDVFAGVLPVNTSGQGVGELSFDIKLREGLPHGTMVSNRAGIVFDTNETIMTPTWMNVVDRITPISSVKTIEQISDSTAIVSIEASDELSGPWRYDVYVQYGSGAWFKAAEHVRVDTMATVQIYEGINHCFYTIATDSAGNVEQKNAIREFTLNLSDVIAGDVNGDGVVNLSDADGIVKHFVGRKPEGFIEENADADGDGSVNLSDARKVVGLFVGKGGNNARRTTMIKQK